MTSSAGVVELSAQECDTAWLVLLTLSHPDLDTPLRFTSDAVQTISNGEFFDPMPFEVSLPDDVEGRAPRAQIRFDNTSQEIVAILRSLTTAPTVTMQIVRSAAPDVIERQWLGLEWRVEWVGINDRSQAWREGRYHLAQQRLRREVHRITVDFEHLACERGDLVALSHDVIAVGLGAARIAAVAVNDGGLNAIAVTLDATVTMAADKNYGIRVRRCVGSSQRTDLYTVVTVPGEQTTLTLTAAPALADAPAAGDLCAFGEYARETLRVLVRDIEPRADLTAQLTLIAEAPGVHVAEQGPIPPYDPVVTRPRAIPAPVIVEIRSDERVMAQTVSRGLIERVVFTLAPVAIDDTQMRVLFRPFGTGGQWQTAVIHEETTTMVAIAGVEGGNSYDFRLQRTHPNYMSSLATAVNGYYVVGRTTPPQPPTNLTIAVLGGQALLRWDLPADLDVQVGGWIEFRHSPFVDGSAAWPNSTSLARSVAGDQTHTFMPLMPGTYLARIYDSGGRPSAIASVTSKQASLLAFSPVDELVEDPAFPGIKDACEVADGALQLLQGDFDIVADTDALDDWDEGGAGMVPSGVYYFSAGLDFGSVQRVRLTRRIVIEALNLLDTIDERTDAIDGWSDIDGSTGAEVDASLWGRMTDDDPAGTPSWSALTRLDSTEVEARAIGQIECRLASLDGTFNLRVSELRLKAEQVT